MHLTEWVLIVSLTADEETEAQGKGPEKTTDSMCFCGFAREVGFKVLELQLQHQSFQ